MTMGLWTVRRAAALLAVLLAALAPISPARAADPVPAADPNLALVPADADAFFTVRAADLAGKLGLKEGKHGWAAAWKKQFGIPLENVARCTLLCPDCEAADAATCVVISTDKPYKRSEVLKACAPDAKTVKHHKKVCHVSATNNAALHFVSDHVLVVADSEKALAKCLAPRTGAAETNPVAAALALAGKHDVVCWSRAVAARPAAAVACYKPRFSGAPAVTVARKPDFAPPVGYAPARGNAAPPMLAFLPVPMPACVEAGTLTLDVGEQIEIGLRLDCADEAGAKKAAKVVRAFVGMMRAELLDAVSEMELVEVMPAVAEVDVRALADLPLKLMRQGEKALARARVKAEGKAVPLSVSIPMDAKVLRSEVAALERLTEGSCPNGSCFPFALFGLPWGGGLVPPPPPAYAVPPGYSVPVPLDGAVPQPMFPPPVPAESILPPPSCPLCPRPTTPAAPASCVPAPPPVAAPPSGVPQSPLIGAAIGVLTPAEPCRPTKAMMKVSVTNVRAEAALLFAMGDGNALRFVRKVPASEVVECEVTVGQRLFAVFADEPGAETFVPSGKDTTWLLRSEAGGWFSR
jgi:hypothetical protein